MCTIVFGALVLLDDDDELEPLELLLELELELVPLPFVVEDVQALATTATVENRARMMAIRRERPASFGLVTPFTVCEKHGAPATRLRNITGP